MLVGAAATAWVAIGITYADSPNGGQVRGNYIGAGHLGILVNDSALPSRIDITGMLPGEHRTTDQLITGSLAGVPSAALSITLSTPRSSDEFARNATLRIVFSDSAPVSQITRADGHCSAPGGYTHQLPYPDLAAGVTQAGAKELGNLTPGNGICVQFQIGLSASAGNDVQGQDADFTYTYNLEQTGAGAP